MMANKMISAKTAASITNGSSGAASQHNTCLLSCSFSLPRDIPTQLRSHSKRLSPLAAINLTLFNARTAIKILFVITFENFRQPWMK
jgi:hypothetical protein